MIINKKIALVLISANVIFLIYSICLFFYFHHTVLPDFSKPEPTSPTPDSLWFIFEVFLNEMLYIGLFWALGAFKEHVLIRGAMLIIIFLKIPALMSVHLDYSYPFSLPMLFRGIILLFAYIGVVMLFVLLLVRNKMIRKYFQWFVSLMFIALVLPSFGGYIYDNFGSRWLLINRFLLVWLSFIPTLLLFINVYNLSKQNSSIARNNGVG